MFNKSTILFVDAVVSLILGIFLIIFPERLLRFFGVPATDQVFYPSILGAVLIGIGLALLLERLRGERGPVGLGLGGAVIIDMAGATAVAWWAFAGGSGIVWYGRIWLGLLVLLLVAVSIGGVLGHFSSREEDT